MLVAAPVALAAQDAQPVLEVAADGRGTMVIDGRTVSTFASPGMPNDPYLSRALAASLFGPQAEDFAPPRVSILGLFEVARGGGARIGPVVIRGRDREVRLGEGPKPPTARVQWFEQDAYSFAEVLAGPHALPAPVVRFRLRDARPGEVPTVLELAPRRRWWLATTERRIAGEDVAFAFAPHFRTTVASAAAGAAIARGFGGSVAGATDRVTISHGVDRPVRTVTLARPLSFGAVSLSRLLVRTADYGSAAGIAEADASEDIVVKGGKRGSRPSFVVYLGADALAGCSTITFDKPAATITLSCVG